MKRYLCIEVPCESSVAVQVAIGNICEFATRELSRRGGADIWPVRLRTLTVVGDLVDSQATVMNQVRELAQAEKDHGR